MNEPRPEVVEHAVACTAPVYIRQIEERPEHIGSGVILSISGRAFLVTAAHVVDALRPQDRPHVGLGNDLVPLDGRVTRSRKPSLGRPADPYDIAAAEIETKKLGLARFPAIPPAWVDTTEADYDDQIFRLIGYPNQLQKSMVFDGGMEASLLHLNVLAKHNELDPRSGRVVRLQLGYDADSIIVDGQPAAPTNLRGSSGGGLWRWLDDGGLALSAILTDYEPSLSRLVGTRMWMAVEAIRQLAPEVVYQFGVNGARPK